MRWPLRLGYVSQFFCLVELEIHTVDSQGGWWGRITPPQKKDCLCCRRRQKKLIWPKKLFPFIPAHSPPSLNLFFQGPRNRPSPYFFPDHTTIDREIYVLDLTVKQKKIRAMISESRQSAVDICMILTAVELVHFQKYSVLFVDFCAKHITRAREKKSTGDFDAWNKLLLSKETSWITVQKHTFAFFG